MSLNEDLRGFWEGEEKNTIIRKKDYPIKVVFLDSMADSIRKVVHYVEGKGLFECSGDNCNLCSTSNNKPRKTFYMEVYDIEEGRSRILTGGKKLALALLDWETEINEEGDEEGIKGKAFKISRLGDDMNPTWQIKPVVFNKKVKKEIDVEAEVSKFIKSSDSYSPEEELDEGDEFDV